MNASSLSGKYFLVTGTGKYFKNVKEDPETNAGIFRISQDGKKAEPYGDIRMAEDSQANYSHT